MNPSFIQPCLASLAEVLILYRVQVLGPLCEENVGFTLHFLDFDSDISRLFLALLDGLDEILVGLAGVLCFVVHDGGVEAHRFL